MMEVNWKQILAVNPETIDDEDRKDEIFEELIRFSEYDKFDGKSFRKFFKLSQHLLRYKGEQVSSLLAELDTLATKEAEREIIGTPEYKSLEAENAKLRKHAERLEFSNVQAKGKIKELSEELLGMQKKYQDSHFGSEREDSPDALSDLDRQQELLNNISAKNKHIKRLLKDIETLESESGGFRRQIQELRDALGEATASLASVTDKYAEAKYKIREQNDHTDALGAKVKDLAEALVAMQKEMEDRDNEIDSFGRKLEERAYAWKNLLEEKDTELERLREKYEELLEKHPGYNIDAERKEMRRLEDEVKEKSEKIVRLEVELEELRCTQSQDAPDASARSTSRTCCEDTQILLAQAKEKITEMEFAMISLEEDNVLKAKQSLEAIEALRQYESGADGLPQALTKIATLERKVKSRDKQICALVAELNAAQNVASENAVLRKKLGLAEDEFISTVSFHAKQRKLEKLAERLQLKLRASEEMRLQLKLEKNDLKRRLSSHPRNTEDLPADTKICEKCLKNFIPDDSLCPLCTQRDNQKHNHPEESKKLKELEENYRIVVEENENLRVGMHEILHKLRNYDATSDHITIDSTTLEKLLHALDARSISGWYHPAMRMQNELLAVKEREFALKERVRVSEKQTSTQTLPQEPKKLPGSNIATQTDLVEEISTNFDTLFGHIAEKTRELDEIREKCSAIATELQEKIHEIDSMKQQGEELKQLREILSLSADERDQNLLKKSEEFSRIEEEVQENRRKLEFLMVDYENAAEELKHERRDRILLMAELEKELVNRKMRLRGMEEEISTLRQEISQQVSGNEHKKLQNHLQATQNKLARICTGILQNLPTSDREKLLADDPEVLKDFAIVDSNLTVDFMTRQEFLEMKYEARKVREEVTRLQNEKKHLEDILKVAQLQISSQQDLLTRYSDEEISLRHLVVDLQCSGSEKQLIARGAREIESLKESEQKLKKQVENLTAKLKDVEGKLAESEEKLSNSQEEATKERKNDLLKINYLTQSLQMLRVSYCKFTPLFLVVEFVETLGKTVELQKILQEEHTALGGKFHEDTMEKCLRKVRESIKNDGIEDKIAMVRYQTQAEELEKQLNDSQKLRGALQRELIELKLSNAENAQHWNTLELLLKANAPKEGRKINCQEREVQCGVEVATKATNTDGEFVQRLPEEPIEVLQKTTKASPEKFLDSNRMSETEMKASNKCLESQLKQAMSLASTRSALLLETESRLAEAQGRIKAFEKALEEKEKLLREERDRNVTNGEKSSRKDDNILSITIASLQNLLLEKDTTLSRYQELLKTERNEHSKSTSEYQKEIHALREEINQQTRKLRETETTVDDLEGKIRDLSIVKPKIDSPGVSPEHEKLFLDDRYLDEMFLDEKRVLTNGAYREHIENLERKLTDSDEEIRRLQLQLREVSNREGMWEKNLTEKDREIAALNERFNTDLQDISDSIASRREIEQLREMLEEKDRHINDLTDTLTHFHDDQQKFMSDATLHSADQLAQLSAELSRAEATNKVLNTQIEALKRQIANLSQREKQAREMVKTLKNQLIRRPVISIKNERITTREENLQRRVEQLQSELVTTKEDLRKQTNLAESRKAKSASDLNLWEKQKRWQGVAEKQKLKLAEKESELEKLKLNFNTAKATISRLEREKQVLDGRLRGGSRFCHATSCPHSHSGKYTPAESPESEDEYDEGAIKGVTRVEASHDIVEALKARIESQQRRIVAMELEGKGSSAVASEVEKLQERLSTLEAQNLRLEAKNLQLQLDNDMLRQGDDGERQKRRMKHMEDYILVLKNELSQANAKGNPPTQPLSDSHQTILALRRIVERLKVENKSLREGKSTSKEVISKETFEKLRAEYERIQTLHSEALARVSSLEIELDLHTKAEGAGKTSPVDVADDVAKIRDKLRHRTELLEKAKLLLTRAAAKEKNLREQIIFWKRKCSELQNVPFIEETSE